MNVDKNLLMYDVVAVTIVRDEAPYMKEWLDYHLLAGVDHFLIYDNESRDGLKEILQPYLSKNVVTLIDYPQANRQLEVYNDAVRYLKYFCRRMLFIDVDDFVFPQSDKSIAEVADELLGDDNAGLAMNLHVFGASDIAKADYSIGVLERFKRRAVDDWAPLNGEIPSGNAAVKTIANPRRIKFFRDNSHCPEYFDGYHAINEGGKIVDKSFNLPVSAEKIVVNYYATKSREEYLRKIQRIKVAGFVQRNEPEGFDANNQNDILDEEILSYRERLIAKQIPAGGDTLKILAGRKRINNGRLFQALVENLTPDFSKGNLKKFFDNPKNRTKYFNDLVNLYKRESPNFFNGKMETYLTCFVLSSYLKKNFLDDTTGALFEEASLNAICKTFTSNITHLDLRLFVAELPRICILPYITVGSLIDICLKTFAQFLNDFRDAGDMQSFEELTQTIRWLQVAHNYKVQTNL